MYDWLTDYQKLEEELAYLEYNLEKTETELKRWTSKDLSNVRLQRDSRGANVEEVIIKIKDEIEQKQMQIGRLLQLVNTFKGLDNKILKLKYVDGMNLDTIAYELGYSTSHIYKKHAEMMKMIKFADRLQLSLY